MSSTIESRVVGRYAPTPSGRLHIGNAFSFLITYLVSAQSGGTLRLRVEDLDSSRCKPQLVQIMLKDMEWLGLPWAGEIIYQSRRTELYDNAFHKLDDQGLIYPCFCSRADLRSASAPHFGEEYIYPGTCRQLTEIERKERLKDKSPSFRIKVPVRSYMFNDLFQGIQEYDLSKTCGDFIVRRGDGVYAYQLAVVVDDADMGITSVSRGVDLLSSSPRQLYLQEMLDLPQVEYAHFPLIVDGQGRRLSKRSGDISIEHFRESAKVTAQDLWGKLAYASGLINELQPCSLDELKKYADLSCLNTCHSISIAGLF